MLKATPPQPLQSGENNSARLNGRIIELFPSVGIFSWPTSSTHRQRKDKYYKSLESEVLRLRTSEVALTLQVRDLRNHIEVLQGTVESLTQHCSDISPDRTMISKSNYHSANLDLSNIPSPAHLSNQNLDCGHLYNKNSPNSPDEVIENPDIQEMVPLPHTTIAFPSARPSYDKKWSQDMSHAGMEFVLAYVWLPTQPLTFLFCLYFTRNNPQ